MKAKPSMEDLQRQITENLAVTARLLKEAEERHIQAEAARDKREAEREAARDRREAERAEEDAKRAAAADERLTRIEEDLKAITAKSAERAEEDAKRAAAADERLTRIEEDLKAITAESAKRAAAADERLTRIEEDLKAMTAESAKRAAAADERLTRIEEGLKVITTESGERNNDRGFAFERAVFSALENTRNLCGIHLDGGIRFNVVTRDNFQYDMVALNGKKTIVVEAKITLSLDDVEHFTDFRLPFFVNGGLPEYTDGKEIIGAMVYQRTDHQGRAVKAALARGLLVVSVDNNKQLRQITKASDIMERKRPARKR